jgi:hypothetical protein
MHLRPNVYVLYVSSQGLQLITHPLSKQKYYLLFDYADINYLRESGTIFVASLSSTYEKSLTFVKKKGAQ